MNDFIPIKMKHVNLLTSEIDAAYHQAARKMGISNSALSILYIICNIGDRCLLNDMTHLSAISKQTINSALRKLEAEQILYLEAVNGRQKRVCLTDKGRLLAQRTAFRLIQFENEIFDSWSKEENELYTELTYRFLTDFQKKMEQL